METQTGSNSPNNNIKERFSFKSPVKTYGPKEGLYGWWIEIFLSELIGTFFLMFFGCISPFTYLSFIVPEHAAVLRYSLNWGFVVSSIITSIGHISKAHLNPAVTLCAYLLGHISLQTALVYWVSEVLGCVLGMYGVWFSMPNYWYNAYDSVNTQGLPKCLCCTLLTGELKIAKGFFLEFAATSLLIYVVCSVWDWRNEKWNDSTAIKFALVISMLSMAIGPLTGASMNPARSFGPCLLSGYWTNHWLYWLSPMSASFCTTLFYRYVHRMRITEVKDSYRNIL